MCYVLKMQVWFPVQFQETETSPVTYDVALS